MERGSKCSKSLKRLPAKMWWTASAGLPGEGMRPSSSTKRRDQVRDTTQLANLGLSSLQEIESKNHSSSLTWNGKVARKLAELDWAILCWPLWVQDVQVRWQQIHRFNSPHCPSCSWSISNPPLLILHSIVARTDLRDGSHRTPRWTLRGNRINTKPPALSDAGTASLDRSSGEKPQHLSGREQIWTAWTSCQSTDLPLRKNRQRLPLWPECPAPASKGAARSSAGEMIVHWKVCLKPANSPRKVIHCIPLVSMAEACAIRRTADFFHPISSNTPARTLKWQLDANGNAGIQPWCEFAARIYPHAASRWFYFLAPTQLSPAATVAKRSSCTATLRQTFTQADSLPLLLGAG